MLADKLVLDDWLLIETTTLKAISKDASGYKLALEKLNAAQEKQVKDVQEKNNLILEKHELQKDLYKLRVSNYELENPPWYCSPLFWGSTALAVGFVAGGIVVGYASGGL